MCAHFHSVEHIIGDYPELVEKQEEKRGRGNMVMDELYKKKKLKEPIDVWVVTRGGICTEDNLYRGEGLRKNI
jgi:hypothetical protein